jgi:hypothetical protein
MLTGAANAGACATRPAATTMPAKRFLGDVEFIFSLLPEDPSYRETPVLFLFRFIDEPGQSVTPDAPIGPYQMEDMCAFISRLIPILIPQFMVNGKIICRSVVRAAGRLRRAGR